MTIQPLIFQLSQADEQVVRSYECTKLKRWFQPETIGYLTVTNKRIVFHSVGKSISGKSLLINEMPLEDAAGISVYEGTSVNWLTFLLLALLAFIVTQAMARILPEFLTSLPFAILLMLPFAILWLLNSNFVSSEMRTQALDTLNRLTQAKPEDERDLRTYLGYARIPLYIGLLILIWRISTGDLLGMGGSVLGSLLLIVVYGAVFFLLFGRHQSFSLAIGSKTAKGSAIYIPGDSFRLFFRGNTSALESLNAGPAADAGRIARELGAMLMDIRLLGDHGMEKWREQQRSENPSGG
jgi:hypothetical protein